MMADSNTTTLAINKGDETSGARSQLWLSSHAFAESLTAQGLELHDSAVTSIEPHSLIPMPRIMSDYHIEMDQLLETIFDECVTEEGRVAGVYALGDTKQSVPFRLRPDATDIVNIAALSKGGQTWAAIQEIALRQSDTARQADSTPDTGPLPETEGGRYWVLVRPENSEVGQESALTLRTLRGKLEEESPVARKERELMEKLAMLHFEPESEQDSPKDA